MEWCSGWTSHHFGHGDHWSLSSRDQAVGSAAHIRTVHRQMPGRVKGWKQNRIGFETHACVLPGLFCPRWSCVFFVCLLTAFLMCCLAQQCQTPSCKLLLQTSAAWQTSSNKFIYFSRRFDAHVQRPHADCLVSTQTFGVFAVCCICVMMY